MAEGPKRFWETVAVEQTVDGFGIALDGRPVRTPLGRAAAGPTRALADAMAAEWSAQIETVDPRTMPVTRAVNSALDRVIPEYDAVADIVVEYGESDLLCYRAPHPDALQERQAVLWDPWLDWARDTYDLRLSVAAGVMHVEQDARAIGTLRRAVEVHDGWELTALHDLVTLTGSLVLGLSVSAGAQTAAAAWPLGRIEEDWQIAAWGEDAEAAAAAGARRRDFLAAERFLTLCRDRTGS